MKGERKGTSWAWHDDGRALAARRGRRAGKEGDGLGGLGRAGNRVRWARVKKLGSGPEAATKIGRFDRRKAREGNDKKKKERNGEIGDFRRAGLQDCWYLHPPPQLLAVGAGPHADDRRAAEQLPAV